jgi:GNAT superfamily N-acetyltransferase
MTSAIEIRRAESRKDLLKFIRFPWKVYEGDPNWVPPLISERLERLNPEKNPFYLTATVELFMAWRGREPVGTIAAFVDHERNEHFGWKKGGFGFFEVVKDYEVAQHLLDTVCKRAREWGMQGLVGPTNFGINDEPGILIDGADCPAALLEAHSPPYYQEFLERFGMKKEGDNYAWRVDLSKLDVILADLPEQLFRVFDAARDRQDVHIRSARMEDWEDEMKLAHGLYNAAHATSPEHVPMSMEAFTHFAEQMRPLLDPDLVLFAEMDGKTIGYLVAIPDFNRVLIHLNGRLFPIGWLKLLWYRKRIDRISFKLLGILKEYRRRGIDVLMYLDAVRTAAKKGYRWLDGSLTSEFNPVVWRLAERMGAERYKHYRMYQMMF